MTWAEQYIEAHQQHFIREYPNAYRAGHYCKPKMPPYKKSNGLTKLIINFLSWRGHRATRINVSGRLISGTEKTASGLTLQTKKWQRSTTRRGTADISATINGRSVMLEIKIGADKPSEHQLMEQQLERKAGGIYEFIKTPEDFFSLYNTIVN